MTSTLSISSFGNFDQTTNDQIAAFPEVRQSRTYVGFQISVLVDGTVDASQDFEASGTFDGRYIDQDRFAPTSGRMFERDRVDEVVVNRFAADRYGYHVGQQLVLGTFELDPPGAAPESPPTAPLVPAQTTHVTIVGIGLFPDEVIQDDADRTPRLLLTPAFSEAARQYATYGFQGLVLKRGDADIDAVRERVAQITPPGTIELRITSDDEVHAQRATRPLTVALGAFGIITGLAGIVLVAQSLAGLMRRQRKERSGLRALGASPVTIIWISTVGPAVSIIGGTLLAVALAVAASPLMPIGPIRGVEVQRGIDLDAAVLGFGALVAIVILGPIAWLIARSQLPHRERVQPRHAGCSACLAGRLGRPSAHRDVRPAVRVRDRRYRRDAVAIGHRRRRGRCHHAGGLDHVRSEPADAGRPAEAVRMELGRGGERDPVARHEPREQGAAIGDRGASDPLGVRDRVGRRDV